MTGWELAGWAGQALFFGRFLEQWWRSERARKSVAPPSFWWMSLGATALVGAYSAHLGEPILVAGYAVNGLVYARNAWLAARRAPGGEGRRPRPVLVASLAALALAGLVAGELVRLRGGAAVSPGWLVVAAVGQGAWSARFVVQWALAERRGEASFPPAFWWLSLVGNALLLAYALHLGDAVLVAGYALGPLVQARNLVLGDGARPARPPRAAPAAAARPAGVLAFPWPLLLVPIAVSAAVRDLWAPDEPRYAEVAREVYEPLHGARPGTPGPAAPGLVLRLCGEIYPDKPPLLFWLAGGLAELLGWEELVLRLPSLLATAGTALLVLVLARRWWGPAEASWAPAIYLGTAMVLEIGGRLQIDPLLAFLCTAALVAADGALRVARRGGADRRAARRAAWLGVSAGGLVGLAALAKGPVAYVNVGIPLGLWLALARRGHEAVAAPPARVRRAALAVAVLLAVVPVLAWAVAATVVEPTLARDLFYGQHLERAALGTAHAGPPWKPLLRQPLYLLPWTPAVVGGLVLAWRAQRRRGGPPDPGTWQAALWLVGLFLFFSLVPAKRDLYLLPAYPAAALLAARYLADRARAGRVPAASAWCAAAVPFMAGLVGLAAPLVAGDLPGLDGRAAVAGAVLVAAGAWVALRARARDAARWGPAAAWGWAAGTTALALLLLPALDEVKSPRGVAEELARLPQRPSAIPCVGVHPEGYRYYGAVPAGKVRPEELAGHLAREGADFLALVRSRAWEELPAEERARYRVLHAERVGSREVLVVGAATKVASSRAAPAPREGAAKGHAAGTR